MHLLTKPQLSDETVTTDGGVNQVDNR